jgi:hypothetical protein
MNWLQHLFGRLPGGTRVRPGTARPSTRRPQLAIEALEERDQPSASVITSNFNGTAIKPGSTVWFNSVAKVSGVGSSGATLSVVNAEIDFTANGTIFQLAVPNASIAFSPTVTSATTSFANNTWTTTVPLNPGGNVFLAGLALSAPSGLPGGINPVKWQATFQTNTPGVSLNWQWAAAVYTSFSADYNALNVKPVDSNQLSAYQDSDHAGTPEAYKSFVIGGSRGGGGSNWTGSYSGTASATPTLATTASLGGAVYNASGAAVTSGTVTLYQTNASGNLVPVATTVIGANGTYSFTGLEAGTYTVVVSGTMDSYNPLTVTLTNGMDSAENNFFAVNQAGT